VSTTAETKRGKCSEFGGLQEEFQRFYSQLEELKERNVKVGNRQLVDKIMAMQAAAVTLLSTVTETDTNGLNFSPNPSSSSPKDAKGSKERNSVQGKSSLVLRHISEEENLPPPTKEAGVVPPSSDNHNRPHKSNSTSGGDVEEEIQEKKLEELSEDWGWKEPEEENMTRTCYVHTESISSTFLGPAMAGGAELDRPQDGMVLPEEDDELEYMDLDDYEEEDEVGNSIRMTLTMPLDRNRSHNIQTPLGGRGGRELEMGEIGEKIPMSIISSNAPRSPPPLPPPLPELSSADAARVGDGSSGEAPEPGDRITGNQNRPTLGTPSTSSPTSSSRAGGPSGGKIILDLDDKSRFTEEITV